MRHENLKRSFLKRITLHFVDDQKEMITFIGEIITFAPNINKYFGQIYR